MTLDPSQLDLVFGAGEGTNTRERARRSTRMYVRSLDQLGEDDPLATGRRLTALQAWEDYGEDALLEVAAEGTASLAATADAAGRPLSERRVALGLPTRDVAQRAKVSEEEVVACEASRRLPIQTYERIARVLALDERQVAVKRSPVGNEQLAVRLRNIGADLGALGAYAVSTLAEAAWVAATQIRLSEALCFRFDARGLESSPNYGTPGYPAYRWGYLLAASAREKLGLGPDDPIPSMRELVEDTFHVPLIQCELGDSIAGATLEVTGGRAIVVNLSGANHHAFVRRATIAHELGHLLFDPKQRMEILRVDDYAELDRPVQMIVDRVEQRANAFAVELLAPQAAVLPDFRRAGSVVNTMARFGLGQTAMRHQIRNASDGIENPPAERMPRPESDAWKELFAGWEGAEAFTVDFHPVPGIRPSRAGRFSALVVRAAQENLVAWDTASQWLEASEGDLRNAEDALRELFPTVWNEA